MPLFARNPEKLEAKALDYERRGKTAKAQKYRMKAQRLRGGNAPVAQQSLGGTSTPYFTSFRTPQTYEQNALKWEQRGNFTKAQKNREKVWRLQNPSLPATTAAPMFYEQNRFLGYNAQPGLTLNKGISTGIIHNVLPTVTETHVHPTIVQQTTRPEKIVEVQPVVHREIDAPQVHVIEKHSYEQVRSNQPGVITNKPIIEETVRPRVIEEIQPVVHREVPAPFVERVEQHVTEHITQPTTMTKDVINEGLRSAPIGIAAGGPILNQGLGQQGLAQQGLAQGIPIQAQPSTLGKHPSGQQPANLAQQPLGFNQGLNSNLNNNLRR